MKTLLLQRHAKSTWQNQQTDDFNRPLNEQGERDLAAIGEKSAERTIKPDVIISSPAKRALQTAQAIASYIEYDLNQIKEAEILYTADFNKLISYIQQFDQPYGSIETIMLVGHNPHFSLTAQALCADAKYELSAGSVYVLSFDQADSWQDVSQTKGRLVQFDAL